MFSRALSWLRGIQIFVSFSMRSHVLNAMGADLAQSVEVGPRLRTIKIAHRNTPD
jgi:hypothetical protein